MLGLLKTVAIIFVVYYVSKYAFSMVRSIRNRNSSSNEGNSKSNHASKSKKDDLGEYVDFEEIGD